MFDVFVQFLNHVYTQEPSRMLTKSLLLSWKRNKQFNQGVLVANVKDIPLV